MFAGHSPKTAFGPNRRQSIQVACSLTLRVVAIDTLRKELELPLA